MVYLNHMLVKNMWTNMGVLAGPKMLLWRSASTHHLLRLVLEPVCIGKRRAMGEYGEYVGT